MTAQLTDFVESTPNAARTPIHPRPFGMWNVRHSSLSLISAPRWACHPRGFSSSSITFCYSSWRFALSRSHFHIRTRSLSPAPPRTHARPHPAQSHTLYHFTRGHVTGGCRTHQLSEESKLHNRWPNGELFQSFSPDSRWCFTHWAVMFSLGEAGSASVSEKKWHVVKNIPNL